MDEAATSSTPRLVLKVDRAPLLVREMFEAKGYDEIDEDDENFDTAAYNVYWKCGRFKPSEYTAASQLQRVNHFPKTSGITKKDSLLRNLRRMRSNHGAIFAFFPESYILPTEYMTLVRQCEEKARLGESKPIWILKPTDSSQGRKIFLIRDLSEISYGHFAETIAHATRDANSTLFGPNDLELPPGGGGGGGGGDARHRGDGGARPWEAAEQVLDHKGRAISAELDMSTTLRMLKSRLHKTVTPCVKFTEMHIVQRYLERPLCFHGYKLDLRIYVLLASAQPLRVYWFKDCLVRFATSKYDLSDLDNAYAHLTNTSINKNSESYSTVKEGVRDGCKWSLLTFNREHRDHALGSPLLWARIKAIVNLTLLSIAADIPDNGGGFELLGFDVMIDESLRPWLLEVNCSPALGVECAADREVKEPLIGDLCDLLALQRELAASAMPAGAGARVAKARVAEPAGERRGGGGKGGGGGGNGGNGGNGEWGDGHGGAPGGGPAPRPTTPARRARRRSGRLDNDGGAPVGVARRRRRLRAHLPFQRGDGELAGRVGGSEGAVVSEVRAELQRATAAAAAASKAGAMSSRAPPATSPRAEEGRRRRRRRGRREATHDDRRRRRRWRTRERWRQRRRPREHPRRSAGHQCISEDAPAARAGDRIGRRRERRATAQHVDQQEEPRRQQHD